MLTIKSNGVLLLDGERVNVSSNEMEEFVLANISEPCELDDDVKLKDLLSLFHYVQDFIRNYFLEEYYSVSAIISAMHPEETVEWIEFYKELSIDEENNLCLTPCVLTMSSGKNKGESLKESNVRLSHDLSINEATPIFGEAKLKTQFTLLEVMDCVFSELPHIVANIPEESGRIQSPL